MTTWLPLRILLYSLTVIGAVISEERCTLDEDSRRTDCGYIGIGERECCQERGCCWNNTGNTSSVPYCFFPRGASLQCQAGDDNKKCGYESDPPTTREDCTGINRDCCWDSESSGPRCFILTQILPQESEPGLLAATIVTSLFTAMILIAMLAQLALCIICLRRRNEDEVSLTRYSKISTFGKRRHQIASDLYRPPITTGASLDVEGSETLVKFPNTLYDRADSIETVLSSQTSRGSSHCYESVVLDKKNDQSTSESVDIYSDVNY